MNEDVPISEVRKDCELSVKEFNQKCKDMGIKPYLLNNKKHIELEEANRLIRECTLPPEMQIKTVWAKHLQDARNPLFVYATIEGYPGKHIVGVPLRYSRKLKGKKFQVEVIEDKDGKITARHAWFTRYPKWLQKKS